MDSVGDIRRSVSPNLGAKYLATNGATLNEAAYPDLANVVAPQVTRDWGLKTVSTALNDNTVGISKVGSYYTLVSQYDTAATHIYYATSPGGSWVRKDISSFSPRGELFYVNGYYIVCGIYHNYQDKYPGIAYCSTVDGTYTRVQIASYQGQAVAVQGYGATFIVATQNTTTHKPGYCKSTSISSGWTAHDMPGAQANEDVRNLIYDGTRYVLFCFFGSHRVFYHATNPTGTWTRVATATTHWAVKRYRYVNGYYVCLAGKNEEPPGVAIYYTNNLLGTWSGVTLDGIDNSYMDIAYAGGMWILGTRTPSKPLLLASPTLEFSSYVSGQIDAGDSNEIFLLYDGSNFCFEFAPSTNNYYAHVAYAPLPVTKYLPTLFDDEVYTYIKALK